MSGAIDVIEKEKLNAIENGDKSLEEYKILHQRGYIKNEEDDDKFFNKIMSLCKKDEESFTSGLNLLLCLTYGCNMRCTYCFQGHKIHNDKNVMTKEQVKSAFENVEKYIINDFNKKDYMVTLFGGEPLQKQTFDIVLYSIKLAYSKNVYTNIITNGLELNIFSKELEKYKDKINLQVTLDGIEKIHNKNRLTLNGEKSFQRIVENIDDCILRGLNITLRVNVNEVTSKYLDEFLESFYVKKWVKNKNFSIDIAPVTQHCNTSNRCNEVIYNETYILDSILKNVSNINRYLTEKIRFTPDMYRITGYLRKISCDFMKKYQITPVVNFCEATFLSTFAVGPDNNVYLCPETVGKTEFSAGTYYPELKLKNEFINQFRDRTVDKMDKCSKCNIAAFCGGGCPMVSYKLKGNARKEICGNSREVVEEYLNRISIELN